MARIIAPQSSHGPIAELQYTDSGPNLHKSESFPQSLRRRIGFLVLAGALAATAAFAKKAPVDLGGVACQTPAAMHCPDTDCPGNVTSQTGAAVEPKTGRNFFLDYPCDLKAGEKVTFILSLHGAGSLETGIAITSRSSTTKTSTVW